MQCVDMCVRVNTEEQAENTSLETLHPSGTDTKTHKVNFVLHVLKAVKSKDDGIKITLNSNSKKRIKYCHIKAATQSVKKMLGRGRTVREV